MNLPRNIVILMIMFYLFPSKLYSQKNNILFALERGSSDQNAFVKENNIKTIVIIYQQFFVKNNELDINALESSIKYLIPDEKYAGFAVLDWEGIGWKALINTQNSQPLKFKFYLNQFIMAIEKAKELRPYAKWSYFDLPTRKITKNMFSDKKMLGITNNLIPLLSKLDFLAPELYTQDLGNHKDVNYKNFTHNLTFALEFGTKLNKPVYPFVWHRISPANPKKKYTLISTSQFSSDIDFIRSISFGGKRIDGIIWWQSEYSDKSIREKANKKIYKNIPGSKLLPKDFFYTYYQLINN